jgi:hypothetical protein
VARLFCSVSHQASRRPPPASPTNYRPVKSAKSNLDNSAFSRQGLIEQLESPYGDGFTHAQAVYGVNHAY